MKSLNCNSGGRVNPINRRRLVSVEASTSKGRLYIRRVSKDIAYSSSSIGHQECLAGILFIDYAFNFGPVRLRVTRPVANQLGEQGESIFILYSKSF